jgi:hypothetical protein
MGVRVNIENVLLEIVLTTGTIGDHFHEAEIFEILPAIAATQPRNHPVKATIIAESIIGRDSFNSNV